MPRRNGIERRGLNVQERKSRISVEVNGGQAERRAGSVV